MESDNCCGNGCNNCVLDKQASKRDASLVDNEIESRYQWWTVTDIAQETDYVFSLEFQFAEKVDPEKGLFVPPGAHLIMRLPSDHILKDVNIVFAKVKLPDHQRKLCFPEVKQTSTNDPETTIDYFSRPYSPFEYDSDKLRFRILFRYTGGAMSQRIIRLGTGDKVEWKGFYKGDFEYNPNMTQSLICIAQGVAIAPMINIIDHILDNDHDETRIHLLACCRDFPDILLKAQLRDFLNYWNFKLSLFLPYHLKSESGSGSSCSDNESVCNCRQSKAMYSEKIYFEKINRESLKPDKNAMYVLSGSEAFLRDTSKMLTELDINPTNIFTL